MSDLLVEVGVEELPAYEVAPASHFLARQLAQEVAALGLGGGPPVAYATPRRLAVYLPQVAPARPQGKRRVRGPARERAYGSDGSPTPALLGFCRSHGLGPHEVQVEETAQGAYVVAYVPEGGEPAVQVLPEAIRRALGAIPFRRPMRWGEGQYRFGRPVVWLVALFGQEVLDVTFAGAVAGRESRGHRTLWPGPVPLGEAADYAQRLREARVLAHREERLAAVRQGLWEAASREGLVPVLPEALVQEVTDLVEWPTAFVGHFDPRFLELPEPVVITPMVHHQRQFPARTPDGRLAPAFLAVRNGDDRRLDLVRHGNERVLAARLADAWFFYRRDLERPLEEHRMRLAGMEVGGGLGSMLDRAERVEAVARALEGYLPPDSQGDLARAARLCLADRATLLVGEFPELAGETAALYAQAQGEAPGVVQALRESVLPREGEEALPSTPAGHALALAYRAEEVVSAFAAGRNPTGSEDPYGVRRSAWALVRLGMAKGVPGGMDHLLQAAAQALSLPAAWVSLAQVREFLAQRVEGALVEDGIPPQVAQAVVAAGLEDLGSVRKRAWALAKVLEGAQGDLLLTCYRRAARILDQAGEEGEGPLEDGAPLCPAEQALMEAVTALEGRLTPERLAQEPEIYFREVASLAQPLDDFFHEVLVLDPDPAVRRRRLALLARVRRVASRGADLSRVGRRREERAEGEKAHGEPGAP